MITVTTSQRPAEPSSHSPWLSPLLREAISHSEAIVQKNISGKGLAASVDVYPQVWTRDTVITLLGGGVDGDPAMLEALRASLETLGGQQDQFGQIPFFVRIADGHTEFGSADSNPWFVIGAFYYATQAGDSAWLAKFAPRIIKALAWCESRDFNKTGLMDSGECDDWADLLSNRGKVLFPNVLYAHALSLAAKFLPPAYAREAKEFRQRRETAVGVLQKKFWVAEPGTFDDRSHHQLRSHMSVTLRRLPYFLPWISLFEYGERFDTAGNLLAIVTGLATEEQTNAILDYIVQVGLDQPFPVRVLHPPIQPSERDWRDYYKVFNNNQPHQYHNGGIWPWVGGLYVAALMRAGRQTAALSTLERLALALRQGREPWECNEWLHGNSGAAMGSKYQAWSAGMFLYAAHSVRTGILPGFD